MARIEPRHLELYSPIPPLWTGTATYFEHLVRRLRSIGYPPDRVSIVVDRPLFGAMAVPASFLGYPVIDWREETSVVAGERTRVYFIANNEWHTYVQRSLAVAKAAAGGRIVAVLHDPCCAIVLGHLASKGDVFGKDDYLAMIASQYGERSARFAADQAAGAMPELFGFTTHAQGRTLATATEIWTQSRFAALKLLLESDVPGEAMPRLRVGSHPAYPPKPEAAAVDLSGLAKADGVFRVGMFGWVSRPKRVLEIIRGFALALDRLEPADQQRLELMIVGALPARNDLDIAAECARHEILDRTHIVDFPPADRFSALVGSADLIFNLRYPSCGETSGTLAHALGRRTPVVTSRYQSFDEEPASLRIPPLPALEPMAIAGAILAAFRGETVGGAPVVEPLVAGSTGAAPIDTLLLLEGLGALAPPQAETRGAA